MEEKGEMHADNLLPNGEIDENLSPPAFSEARSRQF